MKVLIAQQEGPSCGKAKFSSSSFGNVFLIEFANQVKDDSYLQKEGGGWHEF